VLYTLTANPAVDLNVTADRIASGQVNRTRDPVFTPNGKGLNVSFALKRFGVPSGIMGFFGGFTGEYITAYCKKSGYPMVLIGIDEITRVNFFVNGEQSEYKFVSEGPFVPEDKQEQLLEQLRTRQDLEILSIHGSNAKGQREDFYDSVLEICRKRNIPVVLDISSPKLKTLLRYRPLLIKPNGEELMECFRLSAENEAEVITALRSLHAMGARNVLLTLGKKGAYFFNGKGLYYCGTKQITQKSSACAGDAFLAGFLSVWLQDQGNVELALKRAAAAGANAAESDGLGDLAKVEEYEQQIQVKKIQMGGKKEWLW